MVNRNQTVAFFSIDMVGSTEYKRKYRSIWPRVFRAFALEYPPALATFWARKLRGFDKDDVINSTGASQENLDQFSKDVIEWIVNVEVEDEDDETSHSEARLQASIPPEEWKSVGDEIIFAKPINHPGEFLLSLMLFREFLQNKRTFTPKFEDMPGADQLEIESITIKGTVWIATSYQFEAFHSGPFDASARNISSVIREDGSISGIEFLGPDIDEGFRVSGYAEPNYLALSVHAATWLLSARNIIQANLEFFVEGGIKLKGLETKLPYPKIFVRASPPLADDVTGVDYVDQFLSMKRRCNPQAAYKCVHEYLLLNKEVLGDPIITNSSGDDYNYFSND